MSKPIRLFKLVTGELVLGKFDEEANMLEDVAIIQVVPTQQGVQMMMLPYGYPFEQEFKGSISGEHFMYEYKKLPDDLETKYLEALSKADTIVFDKTGTLTHASPKVVKVVPFSGCDEEEVLKLAACLVLDAFAFLLPGVVATITAMHVIRKDKNKFRKQVRKPMPKR